MNTVPHILWATLIALSDVPVRSGMLRHGGGSKWPGQVRHSEGEEGFSAGGPPGMERCRLFEVCPECGPAARRWDS